VVTFEAKRGRREKSLGNAGLFDYPVAVPLFPRSIVLLEKLRVDQVFNIFLAFYLNYGCIALLTRRGPEVPILSHTNHCHNHKICIWKIHFNISFYLFLVFFQAFISP
jgi:hypothetical protein